jgi:hypothetical protein
MFGSNDVGVMQTVYHITALKTIVHAARDK